MLSEKTKKTKSIIEGAGQLSLGISMVVAVLLGIGLGLLMRDMFGYDWLLWLGLVWGLGGAGLNVYKAYKKEQREYDKIAKDPKYQNHFDNKDDDED